MVGGLAGPLVRVLEDEAVLPEKADINGVKGAVRAALAALSVYGSRVFAVLFLPLSAIYLLLIGFSVPCLLGGFFIRTVLKPLCGEEDSHAAGS